VIEAGSLVRRELRPDEEIIWSGRPRARLAAGDGEAGFVAALVAFLALWAACALHLVEEVGVPPLSFPLMGLASCVLGLVVVIGRVAAAGVSLTVALAGLAPLFAVAAAVGGMRQASSLVCPACSLSFLLMWTALRWVEHRSTRYHFSRDRGFIEEPGRYVISFELLAAPVARPSLMAQGRLGTIQLVAARGKILLKTGVHMPVPGQLRRLVRVPFPEEVVRAWEKQQPQADTPER
jgi:hypothetical protein